MNTHQKIKKQARSIGSGQVLFVQNILSKLAKGGACAIVLDGSLLPGNL